MIHYWIGDLGHLFVITSFVTALMTAFIYFKAVGAADLATRNHWLVNGRIGFYVHAVSVVGICATLFAIIANHYFEYHYAYSYSDSKLPSYYLLSTFWNGQEGSFLLWMFWHAVLGIVLIHTNRFWEAPVMAIFAAVQAFLASMILGVVIPGLDLKIGSSPFILLRDAMDAPIFKTQPDYIPADGRGLNPLLQNYWMVIHPPTLFLGFAATLIPFSYCIAGLWVKKYSDWVRPALPWALFAGAILGLGILMGGYWAYETLNFGGYWNWDPVENAVYIPWLILVAAIHTMITYKNSETALRASVVLIIMMFTLILYSTFLTRSGVLGEASVHSFTDLGLSGQLLLYLFFFFLLAVGLTIVRWRDIPSSDKEVAVYSREFWIFIGVTTLCLMGFQVLVPTSYPVWNKFMGLFGVSSNLAAPADQVGFYSKFQMWFAIALGILSGVGQFFWWKKIDAKTLFNQLFVPLVAALLLSVIIINVSKVYNLGYALMLVAGLFTIVANGKIMLSVLKSSPSLSGGAITHIGIGMMMVGVMFSAGYSKIVSINNTGLLYNREAGDEFNRDNLLLFVNEPRTMAGYQIEYKGERLEPRNKPGFINPNDIQRTADPYTVVAVKDVVFEGEKLYAARDTFEIYPENTYYEIQLKSQQGNGKVHTLYPRVQDNPQMGMAPSPDIKHDLTRDLYAHVVNMVDPDKQEWSKMEEMQTSLNKEFFANDYVCSVDKVERIFAVNGQSLDSADVAVKATVRIKGEYQEYIAEPIFLIRNRLVGRIPAVVRDLGVRFTLLNIYPETGEFAVGINTRQKDWIIMKAIEKPYINILWIGTLVVMAGFSIAIYRRFREFIKMKAKGQE